LGRKATIAAMITIAAMAIAAMIATFLLMESHPCNLLGVISSG